LLAGLQKNLQTDMPKIARELREGYIW